MTVFAVPAIFLPQMGTSSATTPSFLVTSPETAEPAAFDKARWSSEGQPTPVVAPSQYQPPFTEDVRHIQALNRWSLRPLPAPQTPPPPTDPP